MSSEDLYKKFMKSLHSRWGAFVRWAVGGILGFLVAEAAKRGVDLSPVVQEFITETLTIGFAFVADFVVQWHHSHQVQRLQRIVGAKPDGWVGESTIEAAKDL